MSSRWRAVAAWAVVVVVMLAVGIGGQWCIKLVAQDRCDDKGGHLVRVYGGRGGWVCDTP